jgi:hypothetical protein
MKYLNGRDLYYEIIVSKEIGKLTPKAEKMLILLGKNIIKKFRYYDEKDRDDCLSEAYYQLFKNWHLFDENKTDNAFAYFSEIFKRGLASGYKGIYKMDYITKDYYKPVAFSQLFNGENEINI